ncbi:MAG: hypothetical protein ACI8R4_002921, partial [Paracoccaceae bacterium]
MRHLRHLLQCNTYPAEFGLVAPLPTDQTPTG